MRKSGAPPVSSQVTRKPFTYQNNQRLFGKNNKLVSGHGSPLKEIQQGYHAQGDLAQPRHAGDAYRPTRGGRPGWQRLHWRLVSWILMCVNCFSGSEFIVF